MGQMSYLYLLARKWLLLCNFIWYYLVLQMLSLRRIIKKNNNQPSSSFLMYFSYHSSSTYFLVFFCGVSITSSSLLRFDMIVMGVWKNNVKFNVDKNLIALYFTAYTYKLKRTFNLHTLLIDFKMPAHIHAHSPSQRMRTLSSRTSTQHAYVPFSFLFSPHII